MIVGNVNRNYEIVVPYSIQDAAGTWHMMEAILDTGFTGSLTLPSPVIAQLGLPWHSRGKAILADGQLQEFAIHEASIIWCDEPRRILVQAIDFVPVLGVRLLMNHRLKVTFQVGGTVRIDAIPLVQ